MSKTECLLITGGHGFIGSEILKLIQTDLPIVVIDNLLKSVHPSPFFGKQDFNGETFIGNVQDENLWKTVLDKYSPKYVIHLACETSTGLSATDVASHTSSNINGTGVMLTQLKLNDAIPEKIILASSRAVYGEGMWLDEDGNAKVANPRTGSDLQDLNWLPRSSQEAGNFLVSPIPHNWSTTPKTPTSVYALTKSFQEDLISLWSKQNEVNYTILRFQNVYGPGQSPLNPYTGVLVNFIATARRGGTIEVYEQGEIIRDFIYVTDVAEAVIKSLYSKAEFADVGFGQRVTIFDVACIIASTLKAPNPILVNKYRIGDVRSAFSDKSSWLEDWSPKVDFNDGISKTITFVEKVFSL
jgi:dTDP-L-rhamnose 4-epimerase